MFAFGEPNIQILEQKLFFDFKNPYKIIANAEPERSEGEATTLKNAEIVNWRRGRDSNPRYAFYTYTRFPSVRLKPLGHLSKLNFKILDLNPIKIKLEQKLKY